MPLSLLLLLLLPSIIKLGILLDYAAHYDYYAEVLCVNKARTELNCHGACHVKKEVAKVDHQRGQKEIPSSLRIDLEVFQEKHELELDLDHDFFFLVKRVPLYVELISDFEQDIPSPPPLFS